MSRVALVGYQGKMGKFVQKMLNEHPELQLVVCVGAEDNLSEVLSQHQCDIMIDFTEPEAVYHNAQTAIEAGVRPVIGTTGLTPQALESLSQQCAQQSLGGIYAPNFSLAVNLMLLYAQHASRFFSQDITILESHHRQKKDKPSGTAKYTQQKIQALHPEATIDIHSIRKQGVIANQDIIFGSPGETLTLSQHTLDRQCFMQGLAWACLQVTTLDSMVIGLDQLMIEKGFLSDI